MPTRITWFCCLLLLAAPLPAAEELPNPADFAGNWVNIDPSTRGLTRVDIRVIGRAAIRVHAWGRCHPQDCDWGESDAEAVPGAFRWDFRDRVAERRGTVVLERDQLVIRIVSQYSDGRPQSRSMDRFQRPESVQLPANAASAGVAAAGTQPAGIQRTLKPDGSAEIKYPDGTVKTVSFRGTTIRRPDGSTSTQGYGRDLQIPGAFPAVPSDSTTDAWLSRHADSILFMIRMLVPDSAAVDTFLQGEANLDIWHRIERRSEALNRLLTPQ